MAAGSLLAASCVMQGTGECKKGNWERIVDSGNGAVGKWGS